MLDIIWFTKKVGQVYRDVTPDKVEKDLQALFKPTDTGFGTIGEIGGFIAGGGAGIKLLGAVAKGAKLKKLESVGVTQFNIYLDNGDEENIISEYGKTVIPAMS